MIGLTLDPPRGRGLRPGPSLPTLIPTCPQRPVVFTTLTGLCRRIHRLRAGRPIQLTDGFAAYDGSDTFPILKLWAFDLDGNREYLATLAVQGLPREAVASKIEQVNPDLARRSVA